MNQSDIGWLAGILDGEGSFVLVRRSEKRKVDGRGGVDCRILLAVCDFAILEKYTRILSELRISYRYVKQDKYIKTGAKYSRPNPVIQVYVAPRESVVKLCEAVLPYLSLKRKPALLVLEYAKWRLENSKTMQYHRGSDYDYLRDKEEEYWNRYRSEFVGKARSNERSLMECIIDPSTPLHWPD